MVDCDEVLVVVQFGIAQILLGVGLEVVLINRYDLLEDADLFG